MAQIPPSFNYQNPLRMIPEIGFDAPPEGPNGVDINLIWADVIARGLTTFGLNMTSNTTLAFSQIAGLVIDNSGCGADLDFIFPDTDTSLSIPAYAPYTVVPVFTRATQLYVRGNGVIPGDVTNFRLLNYSPRPVAVPVTRQQLRANVANVTLDGVSSTPLVPAGVNGTLENLSISVAFPKPSVDFNDLIQLFDGSPSVIWAGNIAMAATGTGGAFGIANLSGISVRFVNGLNLVQSGGFAPGGTLSANAYYKTP